MVSKNKGGRPRKEIDWKLLNGVLQYGASLIDCSDLCEVSEDLIQIRIKEKYKCTFTEYRKKKMAKIRLTLLQKQIEVAKNGSVPMLIFLGKNYLGQSDNPTIDDLPQKIEITYKKES